VGSIESSPPPTSLFDLSHERRAGVDTARSSRPFRQGLMTRTPLSRAVRLLQPVVLLAVLVSVLSARAGEDPPENAGVNCPYCHGEPELMEASGILSHGGFRIAKSTTAEIDAKFPREPIYWVETEHFEIGMAVDDYRVHAQERDGFREELTELMEVFDGIKPKTRTIDPWLRVHIYALRLERGWSRFLEFARVKNSDFPDGTRQRLFGEKYMGEGPYVGMRSKFEFLLLARADDHVALLLEKHGLGSPRSHRVHAVDTGTLGLMTHLTEPGLRRDEALHAHFVFNLGHNMLDGYKHYSYDQPVWFKVGFAHLMGRQVSLKFNNFDGSEGSQQLQSRVEDWHGEVRKLIRKGDAPTVARLLGAKIYGELELADHYASWSMLAYLAEVHPEGFACILDSMTGLVDDFGGIQSGALNDRLREAFQECLGLSFMDFDRAWQEWLVAPEEN